MAETIGEIVAWLRDPKIKNPMRKTWRDVLASRIEEAWKRERTEIEAQALSIDGIVEASRHKPFAHRETPSMVHNPVSVPQTVGNAAAMREALENLTRFTEVDIRGLENLAKYAIDHSMYGGCILRAVAGAIREGKNALSLPARNCDIYKTSWDVITHWDSGLDSAQNIVRMLDWLLAPAAERKGEGDDA